MGPRFAHVPEEALSGPHRSHRRRVVDRACRRRRSCIGGGAKIKLVGPLRVRLDYRVFNLQGTPRYETYHRFYVGANLRF